MSFRRFKKGYNKKKLRQKQTKKQNIDGSNIILDSYLKYQEPNLLSLDKEYEYHDDDNFQVHSYNDYDNDADDHNQDLTSECKIQQYLTICYTYVHL